MKIILIQTGGTISSEERGGYLSASDKDSDLIREWKKEHDYAEFEVRRPITILSENITRGDVQIIHEEVKRAIEDGAEGIIITHGSDTFDYTANYLSITQENSPVPIVLINALYPLSDSRTNGYVNFFGAMSFIKAAIKEGFGGVFAANTNPHDNCCRIISGEEVLPCSPIGIILPFNDYCGYVVGDEYFHNYGKYPIDKLRAKKSLPDRNYKLREDILSLQINAVLNFDLIDIDESTTKAVVLGLYHSGTICTHPCSSFLRFAERCKKRGIPIILAGAKSTANAYESSANIPSNCSFAMDCSLGKATLLVSLDEVASSSKSEE